MVATGAEGRAWEAEEMEDVEGAAKVEEEVPCCKDMLPSEGGAAGWGARACDAGKSSAKVAATSDVGAAEAEEVADVEEVEAEEDAAPRGAVG